MRRRSYGRPAMLAVVMLMAGLVAGFAYAALLVGLSVVLAGAGHGIIFPFALSSPFAVGGFVSWPLIGALLAIGGRAVSAARLVQVLHLAASLVYFLLSPASDARPDLANPWLWLFGVLFILGQVVVWTAPGSGRAGSGTARESA